MAGIRCRDDNPRRLAGFINPVSRGDRDAPVQNRGGNLSDRSVEKV